MWPDLILGAVFIVGGLVAGICLSFVSFFGISAMLGRIGPCTPQNTGACEFALSKGEAVGFIVEFILVAALTIFLWPRLLRSPMPRYVTHGLLAVLCGFLGLCALCQVLAIPALNAHY